MYLVKVKNKTVYTLKNTLNQSTTIDSDCWYGFNMDQLENISLKHSTAYNTYFPLVDS